MPPVLVSLKFCMPPEEIRVRSSASFRSYNVIEAGEIKLPKGEQLTDISWRGTLPGAGMLMYPFVKHAAWDRPDELIKIIQRWRERGTKLKLLITQTPVNLDVYIKNFGFTAKGGMGDYFALKSRRHFCRRRENFVMKIRLAKAGFFVAGGAKELACKIQLKIACVEVTRGKIQKLSVTETNKDFYLDIEAADEAGELRHGQDNFYFTDGHTSSAILKEILSKWSVPAEIHVSDVKHGKKVYRKKYLCDMIADVLKDIKEQGGGEYLFERRALGLIIARQITDLNGARQLTLTAMSS
ncbi:MAG: hypothetical protein IJ685_03315 [Selenomonadaceae bacterium]|nr:hypothetical protein [Selenomonadaceae bacterium]